MIGSCWCCDELTNRQSWKPWSIWMKGKPTKTSRLHTKEVALNQLAGLHVPRLQSTLKSFERQHHQHRTLRGGFLKTTHVYSPST